MNLPEEEYHNYPAWSYSLIAKYAKDGFGAISRLHEKTPPTPSMEFGSLFDSVLTRGKATLNEYAISDYTPSDSVKRVMDTLLVNTSVPFDEIPKEEIENATIACSFYPKWGFDAKYKQIAEARAYYEARREGKKVVAVKDWEDAIEMARIFREDPYLSTLFGTHSSRKLEYIYQAQFLAKMWTPAGKLVEIKIMPDLLVVNHEAKTIQPVDLKTSSMPAFDFAENFIKFRYDIQASLYTDVLEVIKNQIDDYVDYTILEYIFTDISRTDKVPASYNYDPRSESQINGLSFGNYQYKNWKTLLDEILYYEETAAKVPSYIRTDGPNDLLELLNKRK